MGGMFGVVSRKDCVTDLFFGIDYHSHLGTKKGGIAVYGENGFNRAIHNISNSPFRTKFENDIKEMSGKMGIGCISDNEPQPLLINCRLGSYAIVSVGRVANMEELIQDAFDNGHTHFLEMSGGEVNQTELIAAMINQKDTYVDGIINVLRKVKGSIFLGIVAATLAGIPLGVTKLSSFDLNLANKFRDFGEVSLFKLDIAGLFEGKSVTEAVFIIIMLVLSFSLVNMFDSMGTLMGAGRQSGLVDENGEVIHMQEALMADAISTAAGALMGTSTVTTVVESSAGIAEGGRTGMTSLVTAVAFLAAIVFAPVVGIVPAAATAPALIFVGVLMLGNIKDVDFSEPTDAVASFCTIVFMPFTYSIANGIAMGLITYCLLKVFTNKAKEVEVLTSVIAVVFVFRYAFMTLG